MRWFFSANRLAAIISKEFLQMRRDPVTIGMVILIPLMQLILFGYAINMDPKHMPTALVSADDSRFTRSFLQAMQNTGYYQFRYQASPAQAAHLLQTGQAQFVLHIPAKFSHDLVRGLKPSLLLEADATDPAATSNAIAAIQNLNLHALDPDLTGPLQGLQAKDPAFSIQVHAVYNPQAITQYNIVPGLLGVVLTMTLVIMTALTLTKEREKGTMENLLAMPVYPIEVMLGKLIPYITVGYLQVVLILCAAKLLFAVPMQGNIVLLLVVCLPFIIANLAVGLTFSTIATNQLQAAQATMFFFLPSILLSGFMFPFRGMPEWAQFIGNLLPLTYFVKIVRGILLKGNGFIEIWPSVWPILVFCLVILIIALLRYRQTLD
jgi:ABC-2 type transport system permease protein